MCGHDEGDCLSSAYRRPVCHTPYAPPPCGAGGCKLDTTNSDISDMRNDMADRWLLGADPDYRRPRCPNPDHGRVSLHLVRDEDVLETVVAQRRDDRDNELAMRPICGMSIVGWRLATPVLHAAQHPDADYSAAIWIGGSARAAALLLGRSKRSVALAARRIRTWIASHPDLVRLAAEHAGEDEDDTEIEVHPRPASRAGRRPAQLAGSPQMEMFPLDPPAEGGTPAPAPRARPAKKDRPTDGPVQMELDLLFPAASPTARARSKNWLGAGTRPAPGAGSRLRSSRPRGPRIGPSSPRGVGAAPAR